MNRLHINLKFKAQREKNLAIPQLTVANRMATSFPPYIEESQDSITRSKVLVQKYTFKQVFVTRYQLPKRFDRFCDHHKVSFKRVL